MSRVHACAAPRIAIIDDQDVVHAGIAAWCASAEPAVVVAGHYRRAVDYFAENPSPPSAFDLVILDITVWGSRPDFGVVRCLADTGHRVIVYSHLRANEVILRCLDLGATVYLVKSEGKRHLIEAIHAAHSGTAYAGPSMAKALLDDGSFGRIKLSEREKQVLIAWFKTESKELVAQQLYLAPTTVRTHLQRIRAKYANAGRAAPTKSALLARAIEDGILGLDDL